MTATAHAHPTPDATAAQSFDRILVPVADAADAESLADTALSLAAAHGATVHALSVVDIDAGGGHWDVVVERHEAAATGGVDAVAERAAALGVETVKHVRYGDPDGTIADYAADHGADLIVMGARDRSGLSRFLSAGSVTPRVQRRSSVPVLTVPESGAE
ncbi:universal stress protein [Halorarum halobium]|uniref:universal stress protein n=1 Tax=Halorarum halobium TaxID=3075121 RepID=UPI0028ADAEEA|nr:universal stress protein [Halobaculum sp. XH14]